MSSKRLFFVVLSVVTAPTFCKSLYADAGSASVVLTAEENGLVPQGEFYCVGKIHAYLRLPQPLVGQHELKGIWIGPDGHVKENSQVPLRFDPPGESSAYLWLGFGTPGLLGTLNPTDEHERLSYNGLWRLEALLDNKTLLKQTFVVHCN